VLGSKFKKLGL